MNPLSQDCGFPLPQPKNGNFTNCLNDADSIVEAVDNIVANPDNIINDFTAIKELIDLLPQTAADCFGEVQPSK